MNCFDFSAGRYGVLPELAVLELAVPRRRFIPGDALMRLTAAAALLMSTPIN